MKIEINTEKEELVILESVTVEDLQKFMLSFRVPNTYKIVSRVNTQLTTPHYTYENIWPNYYPDTNKITCNG